MMSLRLLLDIYAIQAEKRNCWKAFYKLGEESLNNSDHLRTRESSLNEASRSRFEVNIAEHVNSPLIGYFAPFRSPWHVRYRVLKAKESSSSYLLVAGSCAEGASLLGLA